MDFLHQSQIYPNSPQALLHKIIAIQKLKEIMIDRSEALRDEVLLAIMLLASHEIKHVTKEKKKPFNSPLQQFQWLDLYGNLNHVPEHMKAITDILTLRGGLGNVKLPGLVERFTM
jgi:hypothetical protein